MSVTRLQNAISAKFNLQVVEDIVNKKSHLEETIVENIRIDENFTNKGDAYIGQICRLGIEICGKNKTKHEEKDCISVVVKFLPKNLTRRKTFRCHLFFNNEINFYTKVWPPFQKFQEDRNNHGYFDNVPLLLSFYKDGENDFLALSDLTVEGYQRIPRGKALNQPHTSAFLKLLAKFHALSLAFKDQRPEDFENIATTLRENYYHENYRSWFEPHLKNLFATAIDAVDKQLPQRYSKTFENFLKTDVYSGICEGCRVRGPLSVVTHGDVWAPNFLVKYDGENIEKIVIIDFQLSRYTTLSADLTFFLFTCADVDFLEEKWDDLVELYYESLVQNLQELGSGGLVSLGDLHDDLKRSMVFGVGVAIENIIMSLLGEEDVEDLDTLQGDEVPVTNVWKVRPFQDNSKRERFAKFVKFVVDKNFI
ncbi:hypothetical protein Zmor_010010 [Zophobas morio]|uniref:CHK kinase-like domain-containing protein n=1 Tax=Zophobas morio TaxID=2755281 RepID=A0AA38II12_9CUCU|nr:hypothetical protein Zmor_010010 [Zophobas morio]